MKKDDKKIISVVILTYNGEKSLDRCLSMVFGQQTERDFEVICIDSGSKDKTLEICEKYPVRLFQIAKNDFNHGLTRNFAISKTMGEFIILISQDAIPVGKHWMSTLTKAIEEDGMIAGAYCRQLPEDEADCITKRDLGRHFASRKDKAISFIQNTAEYESLSLGQKYAFCNFDNVCSCLRRDIWEKIAFPETYFAEDLGWSKKVLEAGYKIVYEPDAQVVHSHKTSFFGQYKRSYIHHKRLYELFRLSPVPSYRKVAWFSFCNSVRDLFYIMRNERSAAKKCRGLLGAPVSACLKVLGQYNGAKAANENIASNP